MCICTTLVCAPSLYVTLMCYSNWVGHSPILIILFVLQIKRHCTSEGSEAGTSPSLRSTTSSGITSQLRRQRSGKCYKHNNGWARVHLWTTTKTRAIKLTYVGCKFTREHVQLHCVCAFCSSPWFFVQASCYKIKWCPLIKINVFWRAEL